MQTEAPAGPGASWELGVHAVEDCHPEEGEGGSLGCCKSFLGDNEGPVKGGSVTLEWF